MKSSSSILVAACLAGASAESQKGYQRQTSYAGQQLLDCQKTASLPWDQLDLWGSHDESITTVRTRDSAELALLNASGACVTQNDDVETLVANWEKANLEASLSKTAGWHESYHEYDDMKEWYQNTLGASDLVTYVPSIGKSVEGRDIYAVKLTGAADASTVPKFLWTCALHAREWISGATCMYLAERLVQEYDTNPQVQEILDNSELLIIADNNPDGYEYSWSTDRLWRKNRDGSQGVDLNRNFPDNWGLAGSSNNPFSQTYRGPSVMSEPETAATVQFFADNAPIIGALDFHSYTQLVLRPYGYTREDPPDEDFLKFLGDGYATEVFAVHGERYASQKSIELYQTSGTASDWFYGENATKSNDGYRAAGFCIELRPRGNPPGFLLPPDQIIPTGEENYPATLFWMSEIIKNPIAADSSL
jgi:murein tripeptide amidase MpaA